MHIACDQLFREASNIVTQSATDASKFLLLEQKLMLQNDDAKQQCLQVIFVCICMYKCANICILAHSHHINP